MVYKYCSVSAIVQLCTKVAYSDQIHITIVQRQLLSSGISVIAQKFTIVFVQMYTIVSNTDSFSAFRYCKMINHCSLFWCSQLKYSITAALFVDISNSTIVCKYQCEYNGLRYLISIVLKNCYNINSSLELSVLPPLLLQFIYSTITTLVWCCQLQDNNNYSTYMAIAQLVYCYISCSSVLSVISQQLRQFSTLS